MRNWLVAAVVNVSGIASMPALAVVEIAASANTLTVAQAPQSSQYQGDVTTGRTAMTAQQADQYRAEYAAAKAKWAAMTPQEKSAAVASARQKKLADLTAIELVGQRDDMRNETAAESAALKSQADAGKAQWAAMTPSQKQAARKAAWAKKRAELTGIERVGQEDDTYILPW